MTDDNGRSRLDLLEVVSSGAGWHVTGKALRTGLDLLLHLLLANVLLAALYGVFTYAQTFLVVLRTAASHGSETALSRFVPTYPRGSVERDRLAGLAIGTGAVLSVTGSIAVFVLAPAINAVTLDVPAFRSALRIVAIALPFEVVLVVAGGGFIAGEQIRYRALVEDAVHPVLRLVATLVAVSLGYSILGVLAALAVGAVLAALLAFRLLVTRMDFTPRLRSVGGVAREYYGFAAPTGVTNLGQFLYNRADVLVVGAFLSPTAVGIYGVALLLSKGLSLPHSGLRQLFTPVAAGLVADGDRGDLQYIYRTTVRWAVTAAAFTAVSLLVYRVEVLALFGARFTRGSTVLAVAVVGQFVRAAVGPSGNLLYVTDHQYFLLATRWLFGIANVVLNVYLVVRIGLVGPALASAGVLTALNLTYLVALYGFEGFQPYDRRVLKPLVSTAIAGAVMAATATLLPGPAAFVGLGLGLVTMGGLMAAFGFEPDDRRVLTSLLRRS